MKKIFGLVVLSLVLLWGCGTSKGYMNEQTNTGVSLSKNNYKIVKAGARGESQGFNLLCFIPIVSPNFADAKANLYGSVDQKLEGRSIAIANQTNDNSNLCFLLFSIPKLTITADVVEFNDSDSPVTTTPQAPQNK